ncbi:MAG TPA: NAD(P)H-dependent oxidoreductase [Edaphocola sp.]|nr:NAD(P)H-dependent oxidoreductase [Edaphocola sp.]
MTTIISGTNRKDSRTLLVAQYYFKKFLEYSDEVGFLSLESLDGLGRNTTMLAIEEALLMPADKFVLIMPEYNGSFPGVLKLLFDQSDIEKCWWHKKAMLVGLADGRGGNLRGIDHMTGILHYLKMNIFYNKLPLSRIREEINKEGVFLKTATIQAIDEQIAGFVKY